MENFDSLFEKKSTGFNNDQPFDKEAWGQHKQAERAKLYEAIDGMTDLSSTSSTKRRRMSRTFRWLWR